jgi:hypothetical protein
VSGPRIPGTGDVHLDLDTLARELRIWDGRNDHELQPWVRESANRAMGCIDRMLGDLHAMRAVLVTEIRQSDDAAMAHSEALLNRSRELLDELRRGAQ